MKRNFLYINKNFQKCIKSLKNLDFEEALDFLEKENAISTEVNCLGCKMKRVIINCDKNMSVVLAREYHNFRPTQMPDEDKLNELSKEIKNRQKKTKKENIDDLWVNPILKKTVMINPVEHEEVDPLEDEICEHETRKNCYEKTTRENCMKTHYFKLINPWT